MTDAVFVSGLSLHAYHGVMQHEAKVGQTFKLDLVLDPADGAGVSWLHRNSEVMAKAMREDGRLGMTVRADATNAERVKAKFGV